MFYHIKFLLVAVYFINPPRKPDEKEYKTAGSGFTRYRNSHEPRPHRLSIKTELPALFGHLTGSTLEFDYF